MSAEPIHIISLGAGVQSSTMALMAAAGEITPMPVTAVFADTLGEPEAVYLWKTWLMNRLPFSVITVSKGDLAETALTIRVKKNGSGKWAKTVIPTYILNPDGTRGIVQRQCTHDFKLLEIIKEQARQCGKETLRAWKQKHSAELKALRDWNIEKSKAKREKRDVPTRPEWAWQLCQQDHLLVAWIGISTDEIWRVKPSTVPWSINRWPLIEKRMGRNECLKWMERKRFPTPPRSACVYCPYHSDHEWRRMKEFAPNEFQRAVQFEKDLQAVKRETDNMRGIPFLHDSLKPLDQVDFSTEEERGQLNMFNNECEGMCGV